MEEVSSYSNILTHCSRPSASVNYCKHVRTCWCSSATIASELRLKCPSIVTFHKKTPQSSYLIASINRRRCVARWQRRLTLKYWLKCGNMLTNNMRNVLNPATYQKWVQINFTTWCEVCWSSYIGAASILMHTISSKVTTLIQFGKTVLCNSIMRTF